MVFAEIEGQSRTEGGWNMHIAIALIMALLVTAGITQPSSKLKRACRCG